MQDNLNDNAFRDTNGQEYSRPNEEPGTPSTPFSDDTPLIVWEEIEVEIDNSAETQRKHSDVAYVEGFLDTRQIVVLGNGAMQRPGDLDSAQAVGDIDRCLLHIDTDIEWILDELLLQSELDGLPMSKSSAERALRCVTRERRRVRKMEVFRSLFQELTEQEVMIAEASWCQIGVNCFETDSYLTIHALKHFIYQVKQKTLRRPIGHALMSTIFSRIQGCGKTFFVKRLLAPLAEFCPAPVLLSDLADARSQDIFGFSALLVDDMEQLRPEQVPRFKAMVTNEDFARRWLGTSSFRQRRQMATFIGTSNVPVETLIPDSTGHRRFVTLEFRNGDVTKGGDPLVWKTIGEIDFLLLWRSIDAFGPPPVDSIRAMLASQQEASSPHQVIREWLYNLDFASEAVANIHVDAGIQPKDLYELFIEQTEKDETLQMFSRVMTQLTREDLCPLKAARRKANRRYFPVKPVSPKATAA